MAEYMLDTDISSYIMKRSQTVPIGVVAISVITKSELLTWRSWIFLDEAALHYAQIRGGSRPFAPTDSRDQ